MTDSFEAKLRQLGKQQLAEMVNITSYWLATRPHTFPRSPRKDINGEDEFSLEKSILCTLSGAFDILETRMPRKFRKEVYAGENAYLFLQRHPHDQKTLAAWRKKPALVSIKEYAGAFGEDSQLEASDNFASELYEAAGIQAGGIEDEATRVALAEAVENYILEGKLKLENRYRTFAGLNGRMVLLEWHPPQIE